MSASEPLTQPAPTQPTSTADDTDILDSIIDDAEKADTQDHGNLNVAGTSSGVSISQQSEAEQYIRGLGGKSQDKLDSLPWWKVR